jgi:hypothetical protein
MPVTGVFERTSGSDPRLDSGTDASFQVRKRIAKNAGIQGCEIATVTAAARAGR